jgi:hypothetical protein
MLHELTGREDEINGARGNHTRFEGEERSSLRRSAKKRFAMRKDEIRKVSYICPRFSSRPPAMLAVLGV